MATSLPRLIYCADGNPTHAQIAVDAGWEYGCRLPAKGMLKGVRLAFADQDWKRPNRERYMQCLAQHKPDLATVLDWEEEDQLPEVLSWAEEAAQHVCQAILIVPKVPGSVSLLPRVISGKEVWLAYSVPTSYGGSPLGLWELAGWPVHLLGGSPQKQRDIWSYLRSIADVRSVDGNMAKKMATKRCLFWTKETTTYGHWQPIARAVEINAPDECIRRSLVNIHQMWKSQGVLT